MTPVLRAGGHRSMPWKNGGGSTTEIAVSPEGAGLDAFDWRISMAVVAADGPFSAFPGVDRTLAILDGAGLVLEGLGTPVRLDRAAGPFAFPADAVVCATLLDGSITDLNVMTRRGRYHDRTCRLTRPGPVTFGPDAGTAFLLAEAPCRVAVDGATPVDLAHRDALRLDDPAGRRLTLAGPGTIEAYLIELVRS